MEKITLIVLFKNNQVKGILGPNTTYPNTTWWDDQITVAVPKEDWDSEKITISTIRNYLK